MFPPPQVGACAQSCTVSCRLPQLSYQAKLVVPPQLWYECDVQVLHAADPGEPEQPFPQLVVVCVQEVPLQIPPVTSVLPPQ